MVRLLRYILEVAEEATFDEVRRRVIETVGVDAEKAMTTIAEQLRQEGRQLGRQEGEAKGRQEERRGMVLNLLRVRFGALPVHALARVEAADAEQLVRWAERAVTAESLDEVLDAQATERLRCRHSVSKEGRRQQTAVHARLPPGASSCPVAHA